MQGMSVSEASRRPHWYALKTRSRHEKLVRDRLARNGVEHLLPLRKHLSRWSDRKTWIELPLFSGYCFARFSLKDRLAVIQLPGVVGIVGQQDPEPIPVQEIEAIHKLVSSKLAYESHPYCVEGTLVEITGGPLVGLRGQFVRNANETLVVIRVHLIQQAVVVHVNASEIMPVA